MLKDLFWKLFEKDGKIDYYLAYKELSEENQSLKNYESDHINDKVDS